VTILPAVNYVEMRQAKKYRTFNLKRHFVSSVQPVLKKPLFFVNHPFPTPFWSEKIKPDYTWSYASAQGEEQISLMRMGYNI
jgi:hypothetical protein